MSLIGHLYAVTTNLANGFTSVADALSALSSVFATWVGKMIGFTIMRSALQGKVMYILEEIFGESNAVAMKFAKWTMIISYLFCLAGLVFLFGQISLTQSMDSVFNAHDWLK